MSTTGEPLGLVGEAAAILATQGFTFAIDAPTSPADADEHGHLDDAAVARIFDNSTIAFAAHRLGPRWPTYLEAAGLVVVGRELHLFHETPGRPGEHHVVGTRVAERRNKACVLEHTLIAVDGARSVARGELVQLLVNSGRAVDWPDWYWDLVAAGEGRPIPLRPRDRKPWGPPP